MGIQLYLWLIYHAAGQKSIKENKEVVTIDDMYSNNFKAVTNTHSIDFKALCFVKLSIANQTVRFSGLISPVVEEFYKILFLKNIINSSEFRTSKINIQMLSEVPYYAKIIPNYFVQHFKEIYSIQWLTLFAYLE